jgi:hypothetical protein
MFREGRFSFRFSDTIHQITNFKDSLVRGILPAVADESFYWAPRTTCANIIIKQCHTIKNFINTNGRISLLRTIHRTSGILGHEINFVAIKEGKIDFTLGGTTMKDLIYSSWSNKLDDFYSIKHKFRYNLKPIGNMFNEKDNWYLMGTSLITNKYLCLIQKSQELISTVWFDINRPSPVVDIQGRQYYKWVQKTLSQPYYFS